MVSNGQEVKAVLDIPVDYGGVSIGQTTARIGVKISRGVLDLLKADEVLCGHRLTGKVLLGERDDSPGQERMWDSDHEVSGAFDVKNFSVKADSISTGLTWSLEDIDIGEFAKFSKGKGQMVVYEVADIPDDAPDDEPRESLPGTLAADGPWAEVPLSDLFEGAILKALAAADLVTVGDLSNYTASEKRLTDLKGVGPEKAAQIEDRMVEFWRDNPQGDGDE